MVDTSSDIVGNYDSEELVDLYNQNEDHEDFNEAVKDEVDNIIGNDGIIDDSEQEKLDEWLSNIDEVGVAWDELLAGLEDTDEDDMTDAEIAEKEGYEDRSKECMDVLQEVLSVEEEYVDTVLESTITIDDNGGTVEATENTDHDLTVQLDGSANPLDDDSDTDGLIYNVTDPADETNILEDGRIPITIDTPELTLQSYDGSTIVFTYEGKDENGDATQRKITINDYDYTKYVIYFEGDSIQDIEKISSWHKEILGSSVCGDSEWSNLVESEGPSAWDEFEDLTSDANISEAIGYIPEAAGLSEAIKSSWETLWQGYIDGDVDGAWAEVVGQYQDTQQKALIEAMVVSMSLDADLVDFFSTFFDSYATTLQGLIDEDFENPTTSGLLALMLIEENTTAGASLGGDLLYPETLFGSEGMEDMGEVKSPDMNIPIDAINYVMDIQAIAGQSYASSLDDALEIQEGIRDDGGYFSISDDQYDDMVSRATSISANAATDSDLGSGMSDTELRNALVQALAQFQEMGMSTVEEARTNFLSVVNSVAGSYGEAYLDDITAGLLYLLMTVDGGTSGKGNGSSIYESLVGTGDADSLLFMSQVETLINNNAYATDVDGDGDIDAADSVDGTPIYYDEIKDDFSTRGCEFTEVTITTITPDTTLDGALIGAAIGSCIFPGIGTAIGFFVGGMWDAAINDGSTIIEDIGNTLVAIGDAITFWD